MEKSKLLEKKFMGKKKPIGKKRTRWNKKPNGKNILENKFKKNKTIREKTK